MTSPTLSASRPAINGWNAAYLDEQYAAFKADPSSISPDLVAFFQGFDLALGQSDSAGAAPAASPDALRLHAGVTALINAYRSHGHFAAKLDAFGRPRTRPVELEPGTHGLRPADLSAVISPIGEPHLAGLAVSAIIQRLETAYCGTLTLQLAHITDTARRRWLIEKLESGQPLLSLTQKDKLDIFDGLVHSEQFERFLAKRYPGDKRFSLEGGEALIPLLDRLLDTAAQTGAVEAVIGMPHRGRLNVLNNILGKTYEQIFTEFEESFEEDFADGGGDVKYHRGYSSDRTLRSGRTLKVVLASNPSHLESVAPVVCGRVRAKQRLRNDVTERASVVPIILHGDAAAIGQGVVHETNNLAQLEGYRVGGSVHVVVNNLIGFTTVPEDGRSGDYCTDAALAFSCPVFHVNGEDPEAVVAAAHLAMLYRQQFKRDVWVDMWCFRKYGHNEQDEPTFTNPVLAKLIAGMPGVVTTYTNRLTAEGVITEAKLEAHRAELDAVLEKAQNAAKGKPHDPTIDPALGRWAGMGWDYSHAPAKTAISRETLGEICTALAKAPDGFNVNPKLKKLLGERAALAQPGAPLTHADGELLAVGSLLLDGVAVRLSGQDCRRGTFSQRQIVLRDFGTGEAFNPLNHMRPLAESPDDAGKPGSDGVTRQAKFCVYDSPLSEFAVMAFDYGYSLADPNMLVMWEGQFGDFANGAQTTIDQYIASAEIKWERWSGLVLLLPHGYEGAGPEHSSARLERFLQLCGNENMQVCYPTTGAQMFHLLRRQQARKFRKPLIVMTPKSMLRIPTSTVDEVLTGHFMDILDDPHFSSGKEKTAGVKKIVLCSGKVYHELADRRSALKAFDIALVRIEQFYPFNYELFKTTLARYPKNAQVVYVQEEPRNAGGYQFIADLLTNQPDPTGTGDAPVLTRLPYIGRPTSATPAVGSKKKSKKEQEAILTAAIGPLAKDGADPKAAGDAKAHVNGTPKPPAASTKRS